MTEPTVHGYPDWQRQLSTSDTTIESGEIISPVTGTVTRGRFFVGNFPAVEFNLDGTSGRIRVEIEFFAAQTGGSTLTGQDVRIEGAKDCRIAIPTGGPWMQVEFIDETGLGSGIFWQATLLTSTGLRMPDPERNVLIRQASVSVGAGATQNDEADPIWPDVATVSFDTTATAYSFRVQSMDSTGTWNSNARIDDAGRQPPFQVHLPAAPVRFSFVNNDAAARLYRAFLVGNPRIYG